MKEVKEGWIETEKDTIVCTLPPIKLLDHNFIDEARTQSFFETVTGQEKTGKNFMSELTMQ